MINPENENSFEENEQDQNPSNEANNEGNQPFDDNSAQQRQIDDATTASEPSFTLEPEKGIADGPEKPDRLFDYDGNAEENEE